MNQETEKEKARLAVLAARQAFEDAQRAVADAQIQYEEANEEIRRAKEALVPTPEEREKAFAEQKREYQKVLRHIRGDSLS